VCCSREWDPALTQSGFMVALGRARQAKGRQYYDADVNLPAFLTAKNLKPFIPADLHVTSSQIEFKTIERHARFWIFRRTTPAGVRGFSGRASKR